jgi:hypothetical protein
MVLVVALTAVGCGVRDAMDLSEGSPAGNVAPEISGTDRVEGVAMEALARWVEANPTDSHQIKRAQFYALKVEGDVYHVILAQDNSLSVDEGIHVAYFHVYVDRKLRVVQVVRGPDEVS